MSTEGSLFSRILYTRDVFVCFFLPRSDSVTKHDWENPIPCSHCYEWVTVLDILQHADFCCGETERLCKSAAVKAIICAALELTVESKAWRRGRWPRPHRTPPAVPPKQSQHQSSEDSLAASFFVCNQHLLQEMGRTMPNIGFCVSLRTVIQQYKSIFSWSIWKKKNCYQQNQQISVLLEVFWNFRCLCVFEEGGLEEVIYIKKIFENDTFKKWKVTMLWPEFVRINFSPVWRQKSPHQLGNFRAIQSGWTEPLWWQKGKGLNFTWYHVQHEAVTGEGQVGCQVKVLLQRAVGMEQAA